MTPGALGGRLPWRGRYRATGGGTLAALALLLAAIAFAPGLRAGFVYDDRRDVLFNPAAQAETFFAQLPSTLRPLLKASYALQDATTGMSPTAFHALNLALHFGAVLAVFALIRRASLGAGYHRAVADRVAGATALLWALHPALADTVTYVSGRSSGLSTLLLLCCLLAATADRPHRALAFLFAVLAPLARETALVTPLLLLAWQMTVSRDEAPKAALSRAMPVWLGTLLAALIIAAMARHRELVAFSLDQRGPLDALRANLFALPEILCLWVAPWRISILPPQPIIHGWTDAPTLIRLAALVTLPTLAVALRHRAPMAALAVLWTLLALLPTNSVIWRVDPVAVRPLYHAGIGLSLLAALLLARARVGLWLAAVLALWLATQTWGRATLFQDEAALFADAAEKAPQDSRAHLMLGLVLSNAGRVNEARTALTEALGIDPFLTEAGNALRLLDAGGAGHSPAP